MTGRGLLLLWSVLCGADLDLTTWRGVDVLEEDVMVDLRGLSDGELARVKARLLAECAQVSATDGYGSARSRGLMRDVGLLVAELNRRAGPRATAVDRGLRDG